MNFLPNRLQILALAGALVAAPAWAAQNQNQPPQGGPPPQEKEKDKEKQQEPKAKQQSMVEAETKIEFPATVQAADGSTQVLLGVGAARKPGDKDPAYAVGIYVDEAKARQSLAKFQGKEAADLQKDADFNKLLMSESVPKSVRMVTARDLMADDVRSWIAQTVQDRVKSHAQEQQPGQNKDEADKDAAEKLRGLIPDDMKQGTVLVFSWDKGGRLVSTSNGRQVGTVESPAVSWALFDAYMGTNPISEKARADAYKGLSNRLGQAKEGKEETPPANKEKEQPKPKPQPQGR